MFTGIVQNTGKVVGWHPQKKGGRLDVLLQQKIKNIILGESIAINGCCLTVIAHKNGVISFDVSDETMRKTAFHLLAKGAVVNMERAMLAQDRFGGHFVLGHVDCVGEIALVKKTSGSVIYTISYPKKHSSLLIEKGSVTLDGISLTVTDLKKKQFSVYIIPHTLKETNLGERKKGDLVNVEFDVLGKYVQRLKSL